MLEISDITVKYGGLTALSGVSLDVAERSFVAIIGANGAGKSTLFRAICGTVQPTAGDIRYRGGSLKGVPTHLRARAGIAHVPEGRHVFKSMTVEENIEVGHFVGDKQPIKHVLDMVYTLFPRLGERRLQLAGKLSGGEQQMLAISRALAGNPSLLLLDEPSMGLAPAVADEIFQQVSSLHRRGSLTVLLVEQRVVEALELCDKGYVLQNGRIVMSGSPEQILNNQHVRDAYVGG